MASPSLHFEIITKTIFDLAQLFENDRLNLSPGFQRQSVWKERDRAKLIDSIFRQYPLPAIFLYKRTENGDFVYDVVDGKQRLESIFRFMRIMRPTFEAQVQLPDAEKAEYMGWPKIKSKKHSHLFTTYKLPVVEIDGNLGDIIDVFVRINSTGKALTRQEQRHARYYRTPFLREAARIASRFAAFFQRHDIITRSQISRMKHVELVCELMLSLEKNDVLNKKTALDKVMSANIDGRGLRRMAGMTTRTLRNIGRMFPKLRETRLCKQTDFYTLAVLIGKFDRERMILSDRKRNRKAWNLLEEFCARVDEVRELQRRLKPIPKSYEKCADYLLTVSQGTDDEQQRRKREEILREIIGSIFARKDSQRGFTEEQRRIIWNESEEKKCCKCGRPLSWSNFTIDHVVPHSRGGRSRKENANLMCQSCNSAKGNR